MNLMRERERERGPDGVALATKLRGKFPIIDGVYDGG